MARDNAIPVFEPELPLRRGVIVPEPPLEIANAIRDASPDAWGRRVIFRRLAASQSRTMETTDLSEITFLLQSGSDRIGALDFQASPKNYVPRGAGDTKLKSLLAAADCIEQGLPLPSGLAGALQHGTSIGGARPKALINGNGSGYIAKFSSSADPFSVVKAEFISMRLADIAGLNAAPVKLKSTLGRDVLLVRRFDREQTERGWARRGMVSALTLLGLDERFAAHASYEALADVIRARFDSPRETLRELFARLTFNILTGNTDDHARNHAAFWDGTTLKLTPAYDICPQPRTGREASQAMQIRGRGRRSQLSLCLAAAHKFLLPEDRALALMRHQTAVIAENWDKACREADLGPGERRLLWRRQFLNGLAFEGLEDSFADLLEDLPGA